MDEITLEKLAETQKAKFDFWIMEKWSVLPTDHRFLELTEEQKGLLYVQYLKSIEPPPKEVKSAHDDDYEEPESYVDPEFDALWDSMDLGVTEDTQEATPANDTWEEVE